MCLRQAGWDSFSNKEQQNPGPGPRRAKRLAQLSASPQGRNGGTLLTTSCSESSLHLRDPGDLSPPQSSHSRLEPAYKDVKPQRERNLSSRLWLSPRVHIANIEQEPGRAHTWGWYNDLPVLQMRRQRLREAIQLVQDLVVTIWQKLGFELNSQTHALTFS